MSKPNRLVPEDIFQIMLRMLKNCVEASVLLHPKEKSVLGDFEEVLPMLQELPFETPPKPYKPLTHKEVVMLTTQALGAPYAQAENPDNDIQTIVRAYELNIKEGRRPFDPAHLGPGAVRDWFDQLHGYSFSQPRE